MGSNATAAHVAILMPVFSDWAQASRLLRELDDILAGSGRTYTVLLVDDCSPIPFALDIPNEGYQTISAVHVLPLHRNLGHQRAIALGLVQIYQTFPCDAVVVMDADGQDRPSDVVALLDKQVELNGRAVVFAQRTRRAEHWIFVGLYYAYQALSWMTAGKTARVGNFSVIPFGLLRGLVTVSEMWNHYAAAVHVARIPYVTIPTTRGARFSGRSTMNFQGWIAHGIGAISVFGPIVGARLLVFQAIIFLSVLGALVLYLPAISNDRGSLRLLVLLGVALLVQGGLNLFALVVMITGGRDRLTYLPIRDSVHFVGELQKVYPLD